MTLTTFLSDSNFKFVKPLSGFKSTKQTQNNKIQHLFHILWYIYFTLVFLKSPKNRIIQKGYSKFITVTAIEQHSRPHKQRMVSLWFHKEIQGNSEGESISLSEVTWGFFPGAPSIIFA